MKEFFEGERLTEDEAFDRYMFNMALLEEIFLPKTTTPTGLSPDGQLLLGGSETLNENNEKDVSDTLMVVERLQFRREMNATRKETRRSRLKTSIDRSLQALKRGQQEVDDFADDEDYIQVSFHQSLFASCLPGPIPKLTDDLREAITIITMSLFAWEIVGPM